MKKPKILISNEQFENLSPLNFSTDSWGNFNQNRLWDGDLEPKKGTATFGLVRQWLLDSITNTIKVGAEVTNPPTGTSWVEKYREVRVKDFDTGEIITLNIATREAVNTTYYLVTFVTNEGTSIENMSVAEGTKISLPLTSRTGFTFEGWYLQSNFGGTKYNSGQNYTVNNNVTFYAKWRENPDNLLTMYSFSTSQNNYTSQNIQLGISTELINNVSTTIETGLKYHYIITSKPITITLEEYSGSGILVRTIGSYDSNNEIYKIEDIYLMGENIKYN